MVSSPASSGQSRSRARDVPEPARGHHAPTLELIGHGALASHRAGGTPTRQHLDQAIALGVDRLELDLCCSADGRLVVRHDTWLADGRFVADVDLADLRRDDPGLLTLDEVAEHLGAGMPLLLDLKMAHAAQRLGHWFGRRRDLDRFVVCTENPALLLHLRFAAPRVARWPSFPDLGERSTHHVQRVIAGLWRTHASFAGLRRGVVDVHRAARHLRSRPHESLARVAGLPWRERLPFELGRPCDDLAAAGICAQQWLISERLVEEAHRAGLHVNTWTINQTAVAPALAAAGVDSMTTDRVAAIRLALGMGRPTLPEGRRRVAQGGGA